MKKLLLLLSLLLFGLSAQAQTPVVLKDSIVGNVHLSATVVYKIVGFLYVVNGATLTIDPGTLIFGDKASKGTLIIERGGKIAAQGTADRPIVFTSEMGPGQRAAGDWGGIIICGRAPINVNNVANGGLFVGGEAQIEGGPRSKYGGNIPSDISGILSYVRIEFPGIAIAPNNETNGLTMGGVGSGTIIDHVQVSYGGDDGFEWFGGAVNAKHLVGFKSLDDDWDTDFGWQGKVQFGVSLRDPNVADVSLSNGFEADNNNPATFALPRSRGTFSNMTVVGPQSDTSVTVSIQTAVAEGLLFLAPEPKSPHGVDVSPDGNYITVSGKLDPHSTIYGMDLIKKAIAEKNFEGTDAYGIPIIRYKSIVAGQVELGAGPLHTQYDDKGYAYTSLFLENAVVKWSLGPPYFTGDKAWKVVDKISTSYNIGHLTTAHGDTRKPHGKYCIAMNKWSIDRHPKMGTLLPQNFQLIDLTGAKMQILVDMPIGIGEPHYAQTASMKLFEKSLQVYPIGTDPMTMQVMAGSIQKAEDTRIERNGNTVDVYLSVIRSSFTPDLIEVKRGDRIRIHVTNIEQTPDATHGFAIPEYNINLSLDAGEAALIDFIASKPGSFSMYCTEFCSALHLEMQGWIIVS